MTGGVEVSLHAESTVTMLGRLFMRAGHVKHWTFTQQNGAVCTFDEEVFRGYCGAFAIGRQIAAKLYKQSPPTLNGQLVMNGSPSRQIKTGSDPRTLPDYAALRDELSKLSHPARPDMNWHYVEKSASPF